MSQKKGIIALMGSGELTATMVEVHKKLLSGLPDPTQALFLDTPAEGIGLFSYPCAAIHVCRQL